METTATQQGSERLVGIWLAIFTYLAWGLFPFYFVLLKQVSAVEILFHRIFWSSALTFIIILASPQRRRALWHLVSSKKIFPFFASALFLGINWCLYIYGIVAGNVLELSLAYYINPLLNMLLGVFVFGEKMAPLEKIALLLAMLGIGYRLSDMSSFPTLALSIAFAFAFYGALRKKSSADAISALFIEATLVLPFLLLAFLFFTEMKSLTLMSTSVYWCALFVVSGTVTSIPLITFSMAVKRVPYYLIGFCQYLTPTMLFLSAIFVFHEHYTRADLFTFAAIWSGILLVVFEQRRRILKRR